MRRLDPRKLVFLDETGTRLGMRREHAYAPIGQRAHAGFLRNFGLNRPVFEYYLSDMLLPSLAPGQVLVLDNYVVHKGDSVAKVAAQQEVELLYPPACSPDLDPIAAKFAKLKAHLKKAATTTLTAPGLAVREALDAVTLPDILGFYSILDFAGQLR